MNSMLEAFDPYMNQFERATVAAVQAWITEGCPGVWRSGITGHVRFEVLPCDACGARLNYDHQLYHPYAQTYRWQGFQNWNAKAGNCPLHPMEVIGRLVEDLAARREDALAEEANKEEVTHGDTV